MFVCIGLDESDYKAWPSVDKVMNTLGLTSGIWGVDTSKDNTPVVSTLPQTLYYGKLPELVLPKDIAERVRTALRSYISKGFTVMAMKSQQWSHREANPRTLSEEPRSASRVSSGDIEDSVGRIS